MVGSTAAEIYAGSSTRSSEQIWAHFGVGKYCASSKGSSKGAKGVNRNLGGGQGSENRGAKTNGGVKGERKRGSKGARKAQKKKGKSGGCTVQVKVYWPSGIDEAFEVPVNQLSTIVESEGFPI